MSTWLGDPYSSAKRTAAKWSSIKEKNRQVEEFNKSMQKVADKQGWLGSNLLSGLAGSGTNFLAGLGGMTGLLPILLAGAAVYSTTKGLKSGRWGGKVGKAMSKSKKLSRGRFSEDFKDVFDSFKTNIDKSASTQGMIDAAMTMATLGAGKALTSKAPSSGITSKIKSGLDKFGDPVGDVFTKAGKAIKPKGLPSTGDLFSKTLKYGKAGFNPVKSFGGKNIAKNILSDLLQSKSTHALVAPSLIEPAILYSGLQNYGKHNIQPSSLDVGRR